MKRLAYLIILFSTFSFASSAQDMSFKKLKLALAQKATIVQENGNTVEYELTGTPIILITDESANRMRLMSPVQEESKLDSADLTTLMKANFDRALDAKYALADGVLWSVYAHPLRELSKEQVTNALYQVKNLVTNYGGSYSSTDFVFGGGN